MLNPKELESLKKLEAKIGKKLQEVPVDEVLSIPQSYSCDEKGNIVGLNLRDAGTADISFLLDFPRLKYLLLSGNQIIDLSPLLPLTKLNRLVLRNNKISRLPAAWADREMEIKWDYNHQNGLYLEGNPLEIPPVEIVQQGDASVRNYFKEKKGA